MLDAGQVAKCQTLESWSIPCCKQCISDIRGAKGMMMMMMMMMMTTIPGSYPSDKNMISKIRSVSAESIHHLRIFIGFQPATV